MESILSIYIKHPEWHSKNKYEDDVMLAIKIDDEMNKLADEYVKELTLIGDRYIFVFKHDYEDVKWFLGKEDTSEDNKYMLKWFYWKIRDQLTRYGFDGISPNDKNGIFYKMGETFNQKPVGRTPHQQFAFYFKNKEKADLYIPILKELAKSTIKEKNGKTSVKDFFPYLFACEKKELFYFEKKVGEWSDKLKDIPSLSIAETFGLVQTTVDKNKDKQPTDEEIEKAWNNIQEIAQDILRERKNFR